MELPASRANVLTILGLVGLLGVIALTAPRWARLLGRTVPEDEPGEETRAEKPPEDESAKAVERHINVKLFFQAGDRPGLVMEERTVPFTDDLSRQLRTVVEELARGPQSGLVPTLPSDTRVLELFVSARGIAYVNLSREVRGEPRKAGSPAPSAPAGKPTASPMPAASVTPIITKRGSHDELMSVYSIVNSLTVNFPAVKRVQILVEDRAADTLAGHVDLTRPLPADMTLLAPSPVQPVPPVS